MAQFKPIKCTEAQMNSKAKSEGQFFVTTDTNKIYIDKSSTERQELPDSLLTVAKLIHLSQYKFDMNNLSIFTSNNKAINNSYCLARIHFTARKTGTITISYKSNGESNYDYGIFGQLDQELSASITDDGASNSTKVLVNCKGSPSSVYKTLTYTVDSKGEHFFDVKYRKDSSTNSNEDTLQFYLDSSNVISKIEYASPMGVPESATKATQDSRGQQIDTTYIKGLSLSGQTLTYTKGSGTRGTITLPNSSSSNSNSISEKDVLHNYYEQECLSTSTLLYLLENTGTIKTNTHQSNVSNIIWNGMEGAMSIEININSLLNSSYNSFSLTGYQASQYDPPEAHIFNDDYYTSYIKLASFYRNKDTAGANSPARDYSLIANLVLRIGEKRLYWMIGNSEVPSSNDSSFYDKKLLCAPIKLLFPYSSTEQSTFPVIIPGIGTIYGAVGISNSYIKFSALVTPKI